MQVINYSGKFFPISKKSIKRNHQLKGKGLLTTLAVVSGIFLSACGGGASSSGSETINTVAHPKIVRSKATNSPSYSPSGNILEINPTFSWEAIGNVTEYRFGHENTSDSSEWHLYGISAIEAGCPNLGDTCEYTPTDYDMPLNTEKAWWVQAKVNGDWQDWSNPIFFTVINDIGSNIPIPTPIAPTGNIESTTPEFSWTSISGAEKYKIGFEDAETGDGWQTHIVWADDAGCESAQTNCTQTLYNTGLSQGQEVAWWVKAEINNEWSDWSETAVFNITTQGSVAKPFIFNVTLDGNSPTDFKIFTNNDFQYNYSIDCDSDGVLEGTNLHGDFLCHYTAPSTYKITISGVFPAIFKLNNLLKEDSICAKKIEILQWGENKWSSLKEAFGVLHRFHKVPCSNELIFSTANQPDLSHVTDMGHMFSNVYEFNQDLSNWDVSNVTDMRYMFSKAFKFNQDISAWDVSNVTNMQSIFGNASKFNQDIGSWDVSHVSNMRYMFWAAKSYNQDISAWNVSNVTDMRYMFYQAPIFNKDISLWDVSHVTNMSVMFGEAASFNQDISAWDVSKVTDVTAMFSEATSFNQDISAWDVSNVTSMGIMFRNATSFNQDISSWDVSKVTNMYAMLKGASSFSTENYDKLLIAWSKLNLQHNVRFDADGIKYSAAAVNARNKLINEFNWNITDGGQL